MQSQKINLTIGKFGNLELGQIRSLRKNLFLWPNTFERIFFLFICPFFFHTLGHSEEWSPLYGFWNVFSVSMHSSAAAFDLLLYSDSLDNNSVFCCWFVFVYGFSVPVWVEIGGLLHPIGHPVLVLWFG